MKNGIIDEIKTNFSHNIKIIDYKKENIVDTKINSIEIFSKIISEEEILVFGNYLIIVCMSHSLKTGKILYEAKKFNKVFCEKLSYNKKSLDNFSSIDNLVSNAKLIPKPEFEIKYITQSLKNRFINIEVSGKIIVTIKPISIDINDKDNETPQLSTKVNNKDINANTNNTQKTNTLKNKNNTEYWQVGEENSLTIPEIMEMDIDMLNKFFNK